MQRFLDRVKSVVKHPTTQLITGVILLISGAAEMAYDLLDTEKNFRLGAHHGIAVFGLVQVIGSLPDIVDGLSRYFEAADKQRQS